MLEEGKSGESKNSERLNPGEKLKKEGETAWGETGGIEGGGIDLNLGTPEPVLSAIRSESPRLAAVAVAEG